MRKAVCYILALFIMIDTVALAAASSFLITFGRESYYQSKIVTHGYVEACKKNITDGINDLGLASGIPKNAITDAVTSKNIERNLKKAVSAYFEYIDGSTSSVSFSADTSSISHRLETSIKSYAKKKGVLLSGDTKPSVDNFVKKSINIYTDSLSQIPFFESILKALRILLKVCRIAAFTSALLLVALSALCAAVSRSIAANRLSYALYGLICAGTLVSICSAGILQSGLQYKIKLFSPAVRDLAGGLISGLFAAMGIGSLALVILCIALILMRKFLNNRRASAHIKLNY